MKKKDAAVIKVLSDIGMTDEPELTPEQENQFSRALDPEKQFLYDVERIFSPATNEAWFDQESEDAKYNYENPIPFPSEEMNDNAYEFGEEIDRKIMREYKNKHGEERIPLDVLGKVLEQGRQKVGKIIEVPIDKIMASERTLDGKYLQELVQGSGAISENQPWFLKIDDKYYAQDGNHRIAAAALRGDREIKGLVLDPQNLQENWAGEDGVREMPNPLPVANVSRLTSISSYAEHISRKVTEQYGDTSMENLKKFGKIEAISVSDIVGTEDMLDGEHLTSLVQGTDQPDDLPITIKMREKYYILDGNHKAAAALIRGDKNITALVFDVSNI